MSKACTQFSINATDRNTSLAAMVVTSKSNSVPDEIVCLTTGSSQRRRRFSCLPRISLEDLRTEVLIRRTFVRFLYNELYKMANNNNHATSEQVVHVTCSSLSSGASLLLSSIVVLLFFILIYSLLSLLLTKLLFFFHFSNCPSLLWPLLTGLLLERRPDLQGFQVKSDCELILVLIGTSSDQV